ncbi:DUF7574 domain-containing protein [Saccharopolyspora pogona]|uniref:DUF7574 domain-containing protein n=1 Tax=Saccharopolyspora pogona TaxID=333966 RepID=UPI001683AD83|nr:hypothetical protein [Saccharopolyspora pogona]
MGYGNPDLYYNPENFGLRTIGEVEWSEPCYSFDLTVVWYHAESGKYYWASDSGCSCPSPFEYYNSLDKAESGSVWQAIAELTRRHGERPEDEYYADNWDYANSKVVDLCGKLIQLHRSLSS